MRKVSRNIFHSKQGTLKTLPAIERRCEVVRSSVGFFLRHIREWRSCYAPGLKDGFRRGDEGYELNPFQRLAYNVINSTRLRNYGTIVNHNTTQTFSWKLSFYHLGSVIIVFRMLLLFSALLERSLFILISIVRGQKVSWIVSLLVLFVTNYSKGMVVKQI